MRQLVDKLFFLILFYSVQCYRELVVKISGGPLVAQLLAEQNGYYFKGEVGNSQKKLLRFPKLEYFLIFNTNILESVFYSI